MIRCEHREPWLPWIVEATISATWTLGQDLLLYNALQLFRAHLMHFMLIQSSDQFSLVMNSLNCNAGI